MFSDCGRRTLERYASPEYRDSIPTAPPRHRVSTRVAAIGDFGIPLREAGTSPRVTGSKVPRARDCRLSIKLEFRNLSDGAPQVREEQLMEGRDDRGLIHTKRSLPRGVLVAHGEYEMPGDRVRPEMWTSSSRASEASSATAERARSCERKGRSRPLLSRPEVHLRGKCAGRGKVSSGSLSRGSTRRGE